MSEPKTYRDLCFFNFSELGNLLNEENIAQLNKWGTQDQNLFVWLAATTEELGELAEAMLKHEIGGEPLENVTKEALQVATLALKIVEMTMKAKKVEAKDTKKHLCDTCDFQLPECGAGISDIEYGDGIGNDNVIECGCYKERK